MNSLIKITISFLALGVFVFTNNVSTTEAFGGSGFFDGGAAFSTSFFGGSASWNDFNSETPISNISNVSSGSAQNVSDVSSNSIQNVSNVDSSVANNVSNISSNSSQNVTNVESSAIRNIDNVDSTSAGNISQIFSTPVETFSPQIHTPTPTPAPVVKEPTCSMSLNKAAIFSGETPVLSWTSNNVSNVIINNSIGIVAFKGSLEVKPNYTTTYIGTFKGEGKTINCQATLKVETSKPEPPVPKEISCTMSVSPSSIIVGENAILTWNSINTESVSFENLSGSFWVSGSAIVSPSNTTTYTGTFKAGDKTVICHSTIKIKLIPPKVCTVTCGGGGVNPPNVYLAFAAGELKKPKPSFIYLSQIPYTGIPAEPIRILTFFFRFFFFGGLLFAFYKIK